MVRARLDRELTSHSIPSARGYAAAVARWRLRPLVEHDPDRHWPLNMPMNTNTLSAVFTRPAISFDSAGRRDTPAPARRAAEQKGSLGRRAGAPSASGSGQKRNHGRARPPAAGPCCGRAATSHPQRPITTAGDHCDAECKRRASDLGLRVARDVTQPSLPRTGATPRPSAAPMQRRARTPDRAIAAKRASAGPGIRPDAHRVQHTRKSVGSLRPSARIPEHFAPAAPAAAIRAAPLRQAHRDSGRMRRRSSSPCAGRY